MVRVAQTHKHGFVRFTQASPEKLDSATDQGRLTTRESSQFWILGCGFGFWILDFGFWVLDFGFWVLGFGFGVLDFVFWILGFGFWILYFGFWVLGFGFLVLDFGFRIRAFGASVSGYLEASQTISSHLFSGH